MSHDYLKLGLFMPSLGGGFSATMTPRTTNASLDYNQRVAKYADQLGFNFLLPPARWKGLGGASDLQGESLDGFTWAASIASLTEHAHVWSTVHPLLFHPLVVAKMGASLQAISNGRWGMNVVTGAMLPELEMFGLRQPVRSELQQVVEEWLDVVTMAWSEQDFDYVGEQYQVRGGYLSPKPTVRPALMNAGLSEGSQSLAARRMDYLFVNTENLVKLSEVTDAVHQESARAGRSSEVCATGFFLVRETEAEAQQCLQRIVDGADSIGAQNSLQIMNMGEYGKWDRDAFEERIIVSAGAPIYVGTPDQAVERIADIAATGLDGLMVEFFDYEDDLQIFGDLVLPALRREGLVRAQSEVTADLTA